MNGWNKFLKNRDGYLLTEVLAAGTILILLSAMLLKGFQLSGVMIMRGGRLMDHMAEAQERILLEWPADENRNTTLIFTAENGETARIRVIEKIYRIESVEAREDLSWRIVGEGN